MPKSGKVTIEREHHWGAATLSLLQRHTTAHGTTDLASTSMNSPPVLNQRLTRVPPLSYCHASWPVNQGLDQELYWEIKGWIKN